MGLPDSFLRSIFPCVIIDIIEWPEKIRLRALLLISLTCVPSARIHWPLVMPKNSVKNYAIAKNMDWSVYVTVIYLVCSVVKMSLLCYCNKYGLVCVCDCHLSCLLCGENVPFPPTHFWTLLEAVLHWRCDAATGVHAQIRDMAQNNLTNYEKAKISKTWNSCIVFFRLSSLIPLMICSTAVNQGTSPNQSIWSVQISDLSSIVFGVLLLVPTETFCSSQTCPCLADSAFHVLWNCSHNCR